MKKTKEPKVVLKGFAARLAKNPRYSKDFTAEVMTLADSAPYDSFCRKLESSFCREIESLAEGDESMIDMDFGELLQFSSSYMTNDQWKARVLLVGSNLGLI